MQEFLEVGQIVNTYGIKGFVKVKAFTDEIARFEKLKTIFVEQNKQCQEMKIEEVKMHKNMVLLKLEDIDTIEEAEKYRNAFLKIRREDAIELPEDSYFIVDLLGIDVYTDKGVLLGNLVDIFPTGSNDVYVVKDKLGKQILLPAIASVVKNINLEERKMMVHLLEGLV